MPSLDREGLGYIKCLLIPIYTFAHTVDPNPDFVLSHVDISDSSVFRIPAKIPPDHNKGQTHNGSWHELV